jgi:hypothetical protein
MLEDQMWKIQEKISERIDDMDSIGWTNPSSWKPMLGHNIVISIAAAKKISEIPSKPWIGREFAFQIPAYYDALKVMARMKSLDISSDDITENWISHHSKRCGIRVKYPE